MKLKNSEKILLTILLIVALGALYYFNVYLRQTNQENELKTEINTLTDEKDVIAQKIATNQLDKFKLTEYQQKIVELAPNYYGSITQSEYVMLIREMALATGLKITDLNLNEVHQAVSEFIGEPIQDDNEAAEGDNASAEEKTDELLSEESLAEEIVSHSAEVMFEASYVELYNFIDAVNRNDKLLSIRDFNVKKSNDVLSGSMTIVTHNVPAIDAFIDKNIATNYFQNATDPTVREDLFVQKLREVKAVIPESKVIENPFTEKSVEVPVELTVEQIEKADVLADFKNGNFFFAGNKPEINGNANRQQVPSLAVEGLRLDYNFNSYNDINEANIVFTERSVMYQRAFAKMRLKAYSATPIKNAIKAELVDAAGKHHVVQFTDLVSADKWQYSYAEMPATIRYPMMVRRLFVEGSGVQQELSGKIYFDNLAAVLELQQADGEVNNENNN